LIDVIFKAIS